MKFELHNYQLVYFMYVQSEFPQKVINCSIDSFLHGISFDSFLMKKIIRSRLNFNFKKKSQIIDHIPSNEIKCQNHFRNNLICSDAFSLFEPFSRLMYEKLRVKLSYPPERRSNVR